MSESLLGFLRGKEQKVGDMEEFAFDLGKGERLIVGSDPKRGRFGNPNERYVQITGCRGLSPRAVEFTDEIGKLRVKRAEFGDFQVGQNEVFLWYANPEDISAFIRYPIGREAPESVWREIEKGSIIVDIEIEEVEGKRALVRLTESGRSSSDQGESRMFQVKINPPQEIKPAIKRRA